MGRTGWALFAVSCASLFEPLLRLCGCVDHGFEAGCGILYIYDDDAVDRITEEPVDCILLRMLHIPINVDASLLYVTRHPRGSDHPASICSRAPMLIATSISIFPPEQLDAYNRHRQAQKEHADLSLFLPA